MNTVLGIIGGLLLLTFLVVAHEFGHFKAGRACDMRIEEFAVGFGPKLFSKVRDGIRYSIRALPLGGFVQFYGEDAQEVLEEPRAFNNRPIWQRFLTLLAGPAMNILLAFVLTVGVLVGYGDFVPVVASVQEGMPAQSAWMASASISPWSLRESIWQRAARASISAWSGMASGWNSRYRLSITRRKAAT